MLDTVTTCLRVASVVTCLSLSIPSGITPAYGQDPGRLYTNSGVAYGGLVIADLDGSRAVNLTSHTFDQGITKPPDEADRHVSEHPTIARVGGRIAFHSNRYGGEMRIFTIEGDGTAVRQVTFVPEGFPATTDDRYPSISPDGSRIAFISRRGARAIDASSNAYDIFIVDADGTDLVQVTQTQQETGTFSNIRSVAWSPDGQTLAFRGVRRVGNAWRDIVGTIAPDGTGETVRALVDDCAGGAALDWSPDSTRLVYTYGGAVQGCPTTEYRILTLGGGSATLSNATLGGMPTNGPGSVRFSPDGLRLAYWGYIWDGAYVARGHVIGIDGSDRTIATWSFAAIGSALWWQPGPALPAPATFELGPTIAGLFVGGPTLQMQPVLKDAQGNVIVRAATGWTLETNDYSRFYTASTGLLTPNDATGSRDVRLCAFNAGLKACSTIRTGPPTFSPTPSAPVVAWNGGTTTVTAASVFAGAAWTASSDQSWLTLSPASGVAGDTITLTAMPTPTTSPRTAIVTIGGTPVTVTQGGGIPSTTVDSPTWTAPGAGGSHPVALDVSAFTGGWVATSDQPWLSVSPTRGTGAATVYLAAMPAAGAGALTVSAPRQAAAVSPGVTSITVTQPVGDGTRTGTVQFTPAAPPTTYTRYLAEGATSTFFDTRIALLNPGAEDTTATITYLRAGQPPLADPVEVPARSRVTVLPRLNPQLHAAEFSTTVSASQPLVVDRTMTWDAAMYGAHAETAAVAPSPVWYLAEGATISGFSLFYLIQNPGDTDTTVRVRYLRTSGAPLEKDYPVKARTRENIWVNVEEFDGLGRALAAAEFSAELRSLDGTPIIVERAMYRTDQGRTFNAGHESMGVASPSTRWFLAEGNTGPWFDQFVLIANPTAIDAQVRVTYLLANGTTYQKQMTAAANARSGIWVDYETIDGVPGYPLEDVAVSTTVESLNGVPLIVERAMWWPGDGTRWYEAHNSSGAVETGTLWAMAEGMAGTENHVQTYVLIANTSAHAGRAKVTLYFDDGSAPEEKTVTLQALSRTNVAVHVDFPAALVDGKAFGIVVEALATEGGSDVPQIVVERAMYLDSGGVPLAAGTNAVATRLR